MPYQIIEQSKSDFYEYFVNPMDNQWYRHEITITYNPKYIYDIPYAESMTEHVIQDIQRHIIRQSTSEFLYNYVVEYQKNGYPHIHATTFTTHLVSPSALGNFEKLLSRKYGKSAIYATGQKDKIHHNDHFDGTWQEYIHKEKIPRYFISEFFH
jgi:hypothetical protein